MPGNNGTGPIGQGARDGRGRENGGRGQSVKGKGSGSETGGGKGTCVKRDIKDTPEKK